MIAWGPDAASLLMRHGPLIVMLVTAFGLRRSLGAWPVYLIVVGSCGFVQWCVAGPVRLAMANYLNMMVGPSMLFILARRQVVPGLRRGQMSEAERLRWIARESLKRSPSTACSVPARHVAAGAQVLRPVLLRRH